MARNLFSLSQIYERSAPAFARESARWSADQVNIDKYIAAGNVMENVAGVSTMPPHPKPYRGTSLKRKRPSLGPYGGPRALGGRAVRGKQTLEGTS